MALEQLLHGAIVGTCETDRDLSLGVTGEERRLAHAFAVRRQAEFLTGRACARAAAQKIRVNLGTLAFNPDRSPTWPAGVVGSISHCSTLKGAAVARTVHVWALGIDLEEDRPIPLEARSLIITPHDEANWALGVENWETVVFSAKESVFKALWPRLRIWYEFEDLDVRLSADGSFDAHIRAPNQGQEHSVAGRWVKARGHIATSVCILADGRSDLYQVERARCS